MEHLGVPNAKGFFPFFFLCLPSDLPCVLHISFPVASIKYKHKPPVPTILSRTGWGMRQISSLFSGLLAHQGKETKTQQNQILCLLDSIIGALAEFTLPSCTAHTAPQTAAGLGFGEGVPQRSVTSLQEQVAVLELKTFCVCTLGNLS